MGWGCDPKFLSSAKGHCRWGLNLGTGNRYIAYGARQSHFNGGRRN